MVYRHYIHNLRAWRGVLWAPTRRHEAIQSAKVGQERSEVYTNATYYFRCPIGGQTAAVGSGA